jgi:hypothetical protein
MTNPSDTEIRERVRERYAAAATAVKDATSNGCCGGEAGCGPAAAFTDPDMSNFDKDGNEVFGQTLYTDEAGRAPRAAVEASLGCGVPSGSDRQGDRARHDRRDARAGARERDRGRG